MKLFKDIILITIITLLMLVGIILTVDLYAYFIKDIKAPGYHSGRFFEFNAITGRFHKPNAEGYWHRYTDGSKYYVKINQFGFADKQRQKKKTKPRIALVGDSTTEFWEASPDKRGHILIEGKLDNRYDVLNFGVRGFGTDQSFLLFKELGSQFDSEIVVLTFCINDIWDNASQYQKPYFEFKNGDRGDIELKGYPIQKPKESAKSGIQHFLWVNSYSLRWAGVIKNPAIKSYYPLAEHFELRPFKKKYNKEDEEFFLLTEKIILEFRNYLEDNGVKLLLVEGIYKPALSMDGQKRFIDTYGDQFDFYKVSRRLSEFSRKNNIEFLSLPDVIRERSLEIESMFHPEDTMHFNARGIEFFAHEVVGKLNQLGWTR